VLKIEVLATDESGHIVVDPSSGSRQVDPVAIDISRQYRWHAGRTREIAKSMWIRWRERLQA
jgi:hypothetical protein